MSELDAILRTITEVEESLARRAGRAEGALLMVWGLVGASIFGFYQLVAWDHDTYHALLGPALPWVWVGPILVGYVASAVVGARLGRVTPEQRRDLRRGLVPGALASLLATVLVLSGRYDLVYGGIALVTGTSCVAFSATRAGRFPRLGMLVGGALAALGAVLLAWPVPYASGLVALAFAVGFLGLGTARYRAAE